MPAAVHLVLRDADADGIIVATRDNWSGIGYSIPANDFKTLPFDLTKPGVYGLIGLLDSESEESNVLYIGEAESINNRLRSGHPILNRSDVIWQKIIIFTTQADDLHKAHIKWIESMLIEIVRENGNIKLLNSDKALSKPNMPEHDKVFVESFLSNMLIIYPLLGLRAFNNIQQARTVSNDSLITAYNEEYQLTLNGQILAKGRLSTNGFILYKDSLLKKQRTESFRQAAVDKIQQLQESGLLEDRGDFVAVGSNIELSSPSLAAVLVTGRSTSGPAVWKTSKGLSLKQLLEKSNI
jgi:hypothetical protein